MEMTKQASQIAKLKALSEISRFKLIFAYLARRTLPSKATDIYSVDPDGFSHATLKEFLTELEKLGIGKFLNSRSFSWEGFDPRKVGRVGVKMAKLPSGAKRKEITSIEELYREDLSDESKEKALIKAALNQQRESAKEKNDNNLNRLLSSISLEDLLHEIGRRGFKVQLEPKE